jgi:two-component system phosphate regulon sensor histidine kinase PhoR
LLKYANWRLALVYALIYVAILASIFLLIRITNCQVTRSCMESGIWVIPLLGLAAIVGVTLYTTASRAAELRKLGEMATRIAAGEYGARILPHTGGEEAEVTRAVNEMVDSLRNELRRYSDANQQLAIVLRNTADGVLITDELGRVLLMNPAASRMLNYDGQKAVGRTYAEVVRRHQLIDLWQVCRNEGREAVAAVEFDRNLFIQAFVTPFEESGTRGFLVILQDLTQVRFLQTVRRDFISNISHELRTPLASLRAIVETLQDGALEEPELAARFLDRADGEIDTMTQMVEELLELARIESGEVPLQMTETGIVDLVQVPYERIQSQADRRGIILSRDIPDDLPHVLADAERMYRVVSNLLHNAIKFTDAGGTVRIAAYAEGERPADVTILVHDNGIGIADDDIGRIFERFYKSDRARTRGVGGTGLGLAIARHLVEAHGGRIWVNSKEGKGTTFYFTIPTVSAATENDVLENSFY